MWEILTLGKTPYSNIATKDIQHHVKMGTLGHVDCHFCPLDRVRRFQKWTVCCSHCSYNMNRSHCSDSMNRSHFVCSSVDPAARHLITDHCILQIADEVLGIKTNFIISSFQESCYWNLILQITKYAKSKTLDFLTTLYSC